MSNIDAVGQIAYSAKPPCAPFVVATTRRPCHDSAPAPHAATTPITSMPGLYGNSGRTIMLPPVMRSRSWRLNGMRCTCTQTSPASGTGIGIVSSFSTSVGRPYSCVRHARIVSSLPIGAVRMPRASGGRMGGDIETAIAPTIAVLESLTREFAAAPDASAPIPGLDWTVEDLGLHILSASRHYSDSAETDTPGWHDLEQGPAVNARLIEELAPERGLDEITAALREAVAALHDAWAKHAPDDVLAWHGDLRRPVRTIAELVLGDVLVHGWDLSRATKHDWTISRADALRAMEGIAEVAPHFVDAENARDFRGTYCIRLRGGATYSFAFDRGTLTVDRNAAERVDCRISADPKTFLLTTYGRITPVRA